MATEIMTREVDSLPVRHLDASPLERVLAIMESGQSVDVEVLERLVALQERATERNARAAFFESLAAFQEECPEIRKTGSAKISTKKGGQYGYSFAPLEEVTRTIRPYLRRHGFSYSWDVEPAQDGLDVICVLRHIDGHEARAHFPVPTGTDAAMSEAQKHGAALTYGKRQSLTSVLGLTTADEDNDAGRRPQPAPVPISMQQADAVDALLNETGSDREKFFGWLGVDCIADMTADDYKRAIKALEAKKGRAS